MGPARDRPDPQGGRPDLSPGGRVPRPCLPRLPAWTGAAGAAIPASAPTWPCASASSRSRRASGRRRSPA
ncbi:MAG: hypothetical protein M0C28_43830 [Candidatus Moduliflexus flocculans]|nr:hypothetical protein [Candidatus Moduliflexus flocculans]